jgi:hypothetical protein
METQPNDETGDSRKQDASEPARQTPQSKLRDLRPEKDPMGAGRDRLRKNRAGSSSGKAG